MYSRRTRSITAKHVPIEWILITDLHPPDTSSSPIIMRMVKYTQSQEQ